MEEGGREAAAACGSETNIHALGKGRSLVVAVGHTDADGRCARSMRRPRVHGDHHKLIHVIGPFVVQAPGRADHASRRDVKVSTLDKVGELRVQAGVAVTGNHWKRQAQVRTLLQRLRPPEGRAPPCSREVPADTLSGTPSLL